MKWTDWLGGFPGVATFALMVCGVVALPLKFPYYDNFLLVVFSAFTYLLAANSAAYTFGTEQAYRELVSGTGDGDRAALRRRARIPAMAGVFGWLILIGLSLFSLKSVRPAAALPSPILLVSLLVLNGGIAWLMAMLGALIGLNVQTVKGTRDLLRMGLTFFLVLLVLGFFLSPPTWRSSLAHISESSRQLASIVALAGALFAFASEFCLRRTLRFLAEKRQGLSILG